MPVPTARFASAPHPSCRFAAIYLPLTGKTYGRAIFLNPLLDIFRNVCYNILCINGELAKKSGFACHEKGESPRPFHLYQKRARERVRLLTDYAPEQPAVTASAAGNAPAAERNRKEMRK